MKNKKFLKALAALAVGTVMASSFAFAACNTGGGGSGSGSGAPKHSHKWSAEGTDNGDGTHKLVCNGDGTCPDGGTKNENHNNKGENGSCSVCGNPNTPVAENITVHFETGEGSKVADQTIKNGAKATRPADPTWAGHVFVDWYTTAGYATVVDFDEIIALTDGDEITFYAKWREATKYDELAAATNNVIAEDFSSTTSLTNHAGYGKGAPGVYTSAEKSPDNVKVENGVVKFGDTAAETKLIVDFGHVKDTVNGYVEVNIKTGTKWAFFRLTGSDDAVASGEVLGIRSDANNKFAYRLDSGADVSTNESVVSGTTYKIEYTVSVEAKTATVKINDTIVANNVTIPGLSAITGLELVSSSDNSKTFNSIDYIAVVAEQASPSEYAEAQAAKFEAKYDGINSDDVLGDISTDVPVATHKNNIASATSYEAVDAAYKAGVTACDAKLLENAISAATNQINNYRSDKTFNTNATAWNEAKTTATTNIGAAKTVEEVKTALANGKAAMDLIEDDSQAAIATITIEIHASLAGVDKGKIGETSIKSGASITVAELEAACNLSLYNLEGFYNELACTSKIETSYTKTASSAETVTLYAKVTEATKATVGTYTFTAKRPEGQSSGDRVVTATLGAEANLTLDEAKALVSENTAEMNKGDYYNISGAAYYIKFKIAVAAGATITIVTNASSNSASNKCNRVIKDTVNLTKQSGEETSAEISGTDGADQEAVVYTANAAGYIEFTIAKSGSNGLRLYSVTITIANAQ